MDYLDYTHFYFTFLHLPNDYDPLAMPVEVRVNNKESGESKVICCLDLNILRLLSRDLAKHIKDEGLFTNSMHMGEQATALYSTLKGLTNG